MERGWRRRHVELPVEDVVPVSVGRDPRIVVVVELGLERGRHAGSRGVEP
jgi:hypothetical protein